MMLTTVIKFEGATPDVVVRELNRMKREAYIELGEEFWRENLPRRFTWSGGRMLGYSPRSAKYERAKRRKHGHNDPLVASGRSRDIATSIMDVRATATQTRTRLRILLHARALNFKNPKSQVTPSDEVRRIADKEVPPLTRKLASSMRSKFDELKQQQSTQKA
jgi:hypothetical protein